MAADGKCETERLDYPNACDEVVVARNLLGATMGIHALFNEGESRGTPNQLVGHQWIRRVYLAVRAYEKLNER